MSETQSDKDRMPDLTLVMPCYNEEEAVEGTIRDLFDEFDRAGHVLEIVAVDNGSSDRTLDILEGLVPEFPHLITTRVEVNQGYGHGLLSGLHLGTAPWVGITCADGQVSGHDIEKLYAVVARSPSPKLVKVRRRFRMDGFQRKVISILYNLTITVLFPGLGSIDVNGNPKLLPTDYARRMNLGSGDWFLDAEIMIKSKRLGLPVFEINVLAQMRDGGKSNVNWATCWEFVVNLIRWRLGGAPEAQIRPDADQDA